MQAPFVSIKSVLDRVYSHPMMTDLPPERAVVWAMDVIRLIGSREYLVPDVIRIHIDDFRGPKPSNMIYIKQARRVITTDEAMSMWSMNDGAVADYLSYEIERYEPMYEATDSFHEAYMKTDPTYDKPARSYTLRGNYIYTGFQSGIVDIAFDKIPLDNDGDPIIPDDPSVEKAIESYIKSQYFGILYDMGKDVARAKESAEKEYCWYVGQAQPRAANVSIDKRESISNIANRLIQNDRPQQGFFNSREYPEKLIKH